MPDLTVGVDGRRARTGANVVIRSLADIRAAASRTGRSVGNLDRRMKAASTTAAVFRRALAGLGAGLALREFVRLGDSFVNVTNMLKIATDTTEELVAVQERLFQISQSTRSNYESNATLFNRLALSSKDLGISLEEVLNVTESLNQAVILSGAATTEASAGLIQLSQGLASNRLSGDELRSILEQLPVVAETIAKSLGITRGELKFFGEQGKLTADVVFKAFRDAREELAVRFQVSLTSQIRNQIDAIELLRRLGLAASSQRGCSDVQRDHRLFKGAAGWDAPRPLKQKRDANAAFVALALEPA